MATTKIRSSSITDGQVDNADLSATVAVTGGQIADDAVTLAKMAGGTDGNLITYDASGDPAYVATGAATNVLTSNGAGAAPTFQAAAAGGKVLQVIQSVKSDKTSTTSTSFVDTGLSVSITPASASNTVLISYVAGFNGPTGQSWRAKLVRTTGGVATDIFIGDADGARPRTLPSPAPSGGTHGIYPTSGTYLDSPSSTVAVVYKIQFLTSSGTTYMNSSWTDGVGEPRSASNLIASEVSA